MLKNNKKISTKMNSEDKPNSLKGKVFDFIVIGLLILAHISIVLFVIFSFKYYGIYPTLFGSLVAIIICLLIIVDIIFFVGFNHKDLALKIISCVLATFIFIGGTIGIYAIAKVNGIIDGILDDGSSEKYEVYSGVFVSYKHDYSTLSDLKGKKIGMLSETTNGLTYIAKSILDEQDFDYATVDTYSSNNELLQALINGDVQAVVITSAYRNIYENDENSNFKDYLNDFNDFCSFEKELKVDNNKSNKNLSKEPFNVLLIGWSRTDIGSTVGLADSIIVATINPQTYTVSMMSIARDSFVPIACYGGAYDKINSGRSTSLSCFIDTVENFIGMDIDYYMEADYGAIVRIVNAIDGIEIDNPVDFELDGVEVPAGKYVANGWQALEFCRERHHMPNGDFDRQKHQKEVIMAIARKFIESGDINLALNAMDQAKEFLDTNFTLQELSQVFNLLLNTRNYTGLNTFDLVDFQNLRITGNGGIMYYSYSMHLPLWVYLIYQGSYDESISHINDVMGNYNLIEQNRGFEFSARNPYVRSPFYSTEYENKFLFTPDPMPPYWTSLTGMTIEEAYAWASANGVTITVKENIMPGDSRYDVESDGLIYSQSVAYGSLISEHSSCEVVVMGSGEFDETRFVPNFVGKNYWEFIDWAENYFGWNYEIIYDVTASGKVGEVIDQTVRVGTSIEDAQEIGIVITVVASSTDIYFDKNIDVDVKVPASITYVTGDKNVYFDSDPYVLSSVKKEGTRYSFVGWYTDPSGGNRITNAMLVENGSSVTLYAHWVQIFEVKLNANGGYCDYSSIYTTDSLPGASKNHYNFVGWFTEQNGGSQVSDLSTLTASTTLYAHYSEAEWSEEVGPDQCACEVIEGKRITGCTISGKGDSQNVGCDCHYEDISTD